MSENTFSDIPKNFFDGFKDRMGNPICCAFIISWCVINWRFIAFLCLSKLAVSQRIEVIDELYIDIWKNLWLPLMCSTAYLVVMPWVLAGYKWFSGFATTLSQKFVNAHKEKQLENALPVAEKECALALKRSGKREIEELRQERNDLLKEKDELFNTTQEILGEKEEIIKEKEAIVLEKQNIVNEKDVVTIEKKDLQKKHQSLVGQLEVLKNDLKSSTEDNRSLNTKYEKLLTANEELRKEKQQLEEDLAVERGELKIIPSEPKREVIADPTATLSHLLKSNTPTLSHGGLMSGAEKAIPDVLKKQNLFGAVSHVDHMTSNDFDQQELLNSLQGLSNPTGLMDPIGNYKKK
ncbi:hypothetical protein [Halodesulfovibrio aestuarii]|uniref:Uncharacterized protein n=1 Tax=Halodesulfovibrio aestuarii TaxID=126333 RepID=A0ABV4JW81_9BACT